MSFDRSFEFILKWEGGFVDDPVDQGGRTKYGISQRAYPNLDIKNLTLFQAKEIYRRDYWLKARCDRIPYPLSLAVFDYAVNAGVSRAVKDLQKIIGAQADGIWGAQTEQKLKQALQINGAKTLAILLTNFRSQFYIDIVLKNNSQLKFLKGWMRRVFDLILHIQS